MIEPIKIRNNSIGDGYPTFLIAEMACAHQGDVEQALQLVEVASKANVDAIQLQIFKKEVYMSPHSKSYDLISKLEISQENWSKVIDLIKKKNILFFAAAYDIESLDFVISKGVDGFKIHSSDTSNPEILESVAKTGKPIFLSCGASKMDEIHKALITLRNNGSNDIILMHGYQGFPTKLEDNHLNFIKTLRRAFNLNVGYYDHVDGGTLLAKIIPIMAIGYGAQVIEKHYILKREDKGIDYESSLNPDDLLEFSTLLRKSEIAIGTKEIRDFTRGEINYRNTCKKSIVACKDIEKGDKITREKVAFLRNEPGIPPDEFDSIAGKIAKNMIKKNQNIKREDI